MLKEKIDNDLKEALKGKDLIKVSTLRLIKAAVKNAEIAKMEALDDESIIAIIKKQVKQRQDSIDSFKKGNRNDLVEKETKEQEVLKSYLPKEIAPEELRAIIKGVIAQTNAASLKDMGIVMKGVMAAVKGAADASAVSAIVKEELSKRLS